MSLAVGSETAPSVTAPLRAVVEGIYALEEWHMSGGVFRPPQVEGRIAFLNGELVLILHNRTKEGSPVTVASYGSYILGETQFSYGYDEPSTFTQTPSGITVSHKAPWEGMRPFIAVRNGQAVVLRAGGGQEFLFTREKLVYSESGRILRVWRRMNPG